MMTEKGADLRAKATAMLERLNAFDKFSARCEACAHEARACRELGNALLAEEDEESRAVCVEVYSRGIALVNTSHYEGDEKAGIRDDVAVRKNAVLSAELLPLYCNRSVAWLRSGEAREAARDAEAAVDVSGGRSAKAHYRLAQAQCALGNWREAEASLDDAVAADASASVRRDADAMRRRIRAAERKHDAADEVGKSLRRFFAQGHEKPLYADVGVASASADGGADVTVVDDLNRELEDIEEEGEERGRREREAMYNAAIRAQYAVE